MTNDHLGSPRINTNESGAVISRHDYHPFGEEVTGGSRTSELGYVADDNRKQFTGYERDDESGLDFAQARMYSSNLGRFSSTDPLFLKKDRLLSPQEFNLYVYTLNNPLTYIDPTGLAPDVYITGLDAEKLAEDINNRDDAAFKVKRGEDGKLGIVNREEINVNSLSEPEKALWDAISDPDHHAVIMGVPESPVIEFGTHAGDMVAASDGKTGINLMDTSDMSHLRAASPVAAGETTSHEVLEAYNTAKTGNLKDYKSDHAAASKYFPEPKTGAGTSLSGEKGKAVMTGVISEITYTRPKKDITVMLTVKFLAPMQRSQVRAHNVGNITGIEVKK